MVFFFSLYTYCARELDVCARKHISCNLCREEILRSNRSVTRRGQLRIAHPTSRDTVRIVSQSPVMPSRKRLGRPERCTRNRLSIVNLLISQSILSHPLERCTNVANLVSQRLTDRYIVCRILSSAAPPDFSDKIGLEPNLAVDSGRNLG